MKKNRYTETQMVTILRKADRRPVRGGAKQHTVSAQTFYSWRKHFRTMEPVDVKRLRQIEQENGRLKTMVADRNLEIDVRKETTRKKWSAHVCAGSWSRTPNDAGCRAAARAPCYRSPDRHQSRLAPRDAPLAAVIREPAGQYPRYGYRKIRISLARQGHWMNADRAYRLWRQAGLQVPRRPRREITSGPTTSSLIRVLMGGPSSA